MKVKELITKLLDYNLDADVEVIAHCKSEDFSITYGGSMDGEGTPKSKTSHVGFYVDSLCHSESQSLPTEKGL